MTKQGDKARARIAKRYPRVPIPAPETVVANGRAWIKVESARPWRPTAPGDVLIGEYVGRSTRPGDGGTVYGVITIRTEHGARTVSGVVISGLFESASPAEGATVRIVYKGEHRSLAERTYRDFELYLARDEMVP